MCAYFCGITTSLGLNIVIVSLEVLEITDLPTCKMCLGAFFTTPFLAFLSLERWGSTQAPWGPWSWAESFFFKAGDMEEVVFLIFTFSLFV